jgi:hypothetical protein
MTTDGGRGDGRAGDDDDGRGRTRGIPYDIAVERAIDATLRRATYGALMGGIGAATLVRGPRARAAVLAFGIGCGVGSAYEESQRAFANVE